MKLYITTTSPYARIVRIAILEKGLQERIETIVAKTRVADSPYYTINPSGRIPYLIRDDGVGMEESGLICCYLDHLDGRPAFDPPSGEEGLELRRLEALARSMLDGLSVWERELKRAVDERSPTILEHERCRSERMLDLWAAEIDSPLMQGPLNMPQITLVATLGLEILNPELQWRPGRSRLSDWHDRLADRASIAATVPPTNA